MARLVLITIPDNADAEAFVEAINRGDVILGFPANENILNREDTYTYGPLKGKAEALWADPTKMCECHPSYQLPNPIGKGDKGLLCQAVQSKTYKWWVCSLCNKPHPHQFQHPKNLLDPNEALAPRKYTLGFRTDRSAFIEEK
jgi:hypothetical protein